MSIFSLVMTEDRRSHSLATLKAAFTQEKVVELIGEDEGLRSSCNGSNEKTTKNGQKQQKRGQFFRQLICESGRGQCQEVIYFLRPTAIGFYLTSHFGRSFALHCFT